MPETALAFINQGITISVYSDRRGVETIFPFDLFENRAAMKKVFPRLFSDIRVRRGVRASEWASAC